MQPPCAPVTGPCAPDALIWNRSVRCPPDWRELRVGVPRFIGPLNVHRTCASPVLEYLLLAVAFFVGNPAGDAFVVVTSLWNLNVAAPLVIALPAEGVVEPPLASVRLPVDYDVLALASAAFPSRGVFRDEFAWIDQFVPERESSA